MLMDALTKDIVSGLFEPEPVRNVMLVSPGRPNRYYETVLEAYENVESTSALERGSELILASGMRWA